MSLGGPCPLFMHIHNSPINYVLFFVFPYSHNMNPWEEIQIVRRQIAKLNHRLMAVELENQQQQQREMILTALVTCYFVSKFFMWLNRSPCWRTNQFFNQIHSISEFFDVDFSYFQIYLIAWMNSIWFTNSLFKKKGLIFFIFYIS